MNHGCEEGLTGTCSSSQGSWASGGFPGGYINGLAVRGRNGHLGRQWLGFFFFFWSGSLKGGKASSCDFLGCASLATSVRCSGQLEQFELEHEGGTSSH